MTERARIHTQLIIGGTFGGLERGKFAEAMPRTKPSNVRGIRRVILPSSVAPPPRWRERSGGASNNCTSTSASTAAEDSACRGAASRTDAHISGSPAPSAPTAVPAGFGAITGGSSDHR